MADCRIVDQILQGSENKEHFHDIRTFELSNENYKLQICSVTDTVMGLRD